MPCACRIARQLPGFRTPKTTRPLIDPVRQNSAATHRCYTRARTLCRRSPPASMARRTDISCSAASLTPCLLGFWQATPASAHKTTVRISMLVLLLSPQPPTTRRYPPPPPPPPQQRHLPVPTSAMAPVPCAGDGVRRHTASSAPHFAACPRARKCLSPSQDSNTEPFNLIFSDEFNTAGRSFAVRATSSFFYRADWTLSRLILLPTGDAATTAAAAAAVGRLQAGADPYWTAVDHFNPTTSDLECVLCVRAWLLRKDVCVLRCALTIGARTPAAFATTT